MLKTVLIFIPDTLSGSKDGYLEGFCKDYGNLTVYYITNDLITTKKCSNIVGYCGSIFKPILNLEHIYMERKNEHFEISIKQQKVEYNIIELIYDYNAFKYTKVVFSSQHGVYIKELKESLYLCTNSKHTKASWPLRRIIIFLIYICQFCFLIFSKYRNITKSVIISHTVDSLKHAVECLKIIKEKNISLKIKNIIFVKLIDIILGVMLVYLGLRYKLIILKKFDDFIQGFVGYLRNLLIYLMGSPIGLKLNYSFNRSLGRFFFYHINLWRVFLQAIHHQLGIFFQLILIPGFFGISFIIAIFCDIISIVTFHTYCIYVYAARLFYLQIRGLSALWRLFIGRKFNPLRNRVDSCEYSSNQLFIGTLGFTIMLFLLPTTLMYYTVFVALRLATVITIELIHALKNALNNIPLYLLVLWIIDSPRFAGNIFITYKPSKNNKHVKAMISLTPLSLFECFGLMSNNNTGREFNIGQIISRVFTGELI
ncbi:phosphatidylinositol glycan anchor biosynthesis class Q isoform X1 [Rhynchophorus ferrugineus]|uniref:phosphatidylinositol glycan anchor biosynthesis class Q isoform X1 n=1 Tax=Rhynchophorus ferrugineus TaxID=354439 RepID=UPI003FCE0E71